MCGFLRCYILRSAFFLSWLTLTNGDYVAWPPHKFRQDALCDEMDAEGRLLQRQQPRTQPKETDVRAHEKCWLGCPSQVKAFISLENAWKYVFSKGVLKISDQATLINLLMNGGLSKHRHTPQLTALYSTLHPNLTSCCGALGSFRLT